VWSKLGEKQIQDGGRGGQPPSCKYINRCISACHFWAELDHVYIDMGHTRVTVAKYPTFDKIQDGGGYIMSTISLSRKNLFTCNISVYLRRQCPSDNICAKFGGRCGLINHPRITWGKMTRFW